MRKMKFTSTLILTIFIFSSLTGLSFLTSSARPFPSGPTVVDGYVYLTGTTTGINLTSVRLTVRSTNLFNFGEIIYEQSRSTNSEGYYIFEDAVAGIMDIEVTKECYSSYFGAYINPVYLELTGYQYTIFGSVKDASDLVSNAFVEISDGSTTHSTTTQNDGYYCMTFLDVSNGIKEFTVDITHNEFDDYHRDLTMNAPGHLHHNPTK